MSNPAPQADLIQQTCAHLAAGRLVGVPTETVYGLAADATNGLAVAAIFAAKGRPSINPLIAHVQSFEAAGQLAVFSTRAEQLAHAFWPGGMTLVLPRSADCPVSELACAGLDTIGVRVPNHPIAQALLTAYGKPLAAPSANLSGRPSPTLAAHVRDDLGPAVAMVLDGGPSTLGLESTVLSVKDDVITLLRPGAVPVEAIEALVGPVTRITDFDRSAPPSPGMILRHYAPNTPMRLEAHSAVTGGILLGFGAIEGHGPDGADPQWSLSRSGNLSEAAANLFAKLRSADQLGAREIAVAPVPENELGAAINDRLRRAAGLE